ncbi:MAG: hypothetical protein ACK559_17315, partial [bacterium]
NDPSSLLRQYTSAGGLLHSATTLMPVPEATAPGAAFLAGVAVDDEGCVAECAGSLNVVNA